MSIHHIVHDINPSFQSDDLVTETKRHRETDRETLYYNEREVEKHSFRALLFLQKHMTNTPTHKTLHTDTHRHRHKVHSSQMQYISNSVLMATPQKKVCFVPPTCVCVCVCVYACMCARGLMQLFHVAPMLMSSWDAET